MHNSIGQFREAILSYGMSPPKDITPGVFHRMPGIGKKASNTSGYCFLFPDTNGGIIGDFASDLRAVWKMHRQHPYSAKERAAFARQKYIANREIEQCRIEAQERAQKSWEQATPALETHPYLLKKRIRPHGIKQTVSNSLVIPMSINQTLLSLQYIAPDGQKRFLKGGQLRGCYHILGSPNPSLPLCIAEGFATGASIHQATGYPVAIAFAATNLLPVAQNLQKRFPNIQLILCADDDAHTPGNPGITKAKEAAKIVGGIVAIPTMEKIND